MMISGMVNPAVDDTAAFLIWIAGFAVGFVVGLLTMMWLEDTKLPPK